MNVHENQMFDEHFAASSLSVRVSGLRKPE